MIKVETTKIMRKDQMLKSSRRISRNSTITTIIIKMRKRREENLKEDPEERVEEKQESLPLKAGDNLTRRKRRKSITNLKRITIILMSQLKIGRRKRKMNTINLKHINIITLTPSLMEIMTIMELGSRKKREIMNITINQELTQILLQMNSMRTTETGLTRREIEATMEINTTKALTLKLM